MTVSLQETSHDIICSFIQGLSSEVVPIDIGDTEQSAFREALRRYFDSLPHHGISSSSDRAKIERVIEFSTFHCRVTTFSEARHIERCVVPYKGWKVPQLRRSEENTQPWEFGWAPDAAPTKDVEKKIIADSQKIQPCSNCNAVGTLNCGTCNCAGKVGCQSCQLTGIVNCPACKGHGKIPREKQVQKFRPCGSCGTNALMNVLAVFDNNPYTNARRCSKCNGTGKERYFEMEKYLEACAACKEKGKVRCDICKGLRSLRCPTCSGKGSLVCEHCKGLKSVVSYLELRRSFEPDSRERTVVGDQAAKFLERSFQEPFSLGRITKLSWADENPNVLAASLETNARVARGIGASVNKTIQLLLAESIASAPDTMRKTAWKVEIQVYRAMLVTYVIGERKYQTIWEEDQIPEVDSNNASATVRPHPSIISAWCRNELKKVQSVAQTSGFRDAAIDYQKLEAIAKIDPACKAAIEAGREDHGLDQVAMASGRICVSQAQIVMYVTSGLICVASLVLFFLAKDKIPAIACFVFSLLASLFSWKILKR